MKPVLGVILSVILLVSSGVLFFLEKIENGFRRIFSEFAELQPIEIADLLEEARSEIFAPPPLRKFERGPTATITATGIVAETNAARGSEGLGALTENTELSRAARLKLDDMITENYFAHVSPSGTGPDAWAREAGYRYILIGENLAMGNFSDERDLVGAWMDSAGHRANILNPKFRQIGVAVGRGVIEGQTALVAVQMFGMPVSVCPEPDEELKIALEKFDAELDRLRIAIDDLKKRIEETDDRDLRDALVEAYNDAIAKHNGIVAEARKLAARYNDDVRAFNACAIQTK